MNEVVSELYLSTVLGNTVISDQGQQIGKLWDLVMTAGEIVPEVSHLLVKSQTSTLAIPWNDISLFNRFVISIKGEAEPLSYGTREGEILVRRDILDKQIVDINGAKVVRVNDLKLGNHKNFLCIFAVDIGFRGLLRRLGYEKLGEKIARGLNKELSHQEISWEYVQPLELNLSRLTLTMAQEQMADMHPADIAGIISQISPKQIQTVLTSLDTETAGEAIHELDPELRTRVITQLDSEQASDILEEMDPDEAADVLGDLPEEKAQELLGLMDEEEAEDIQELMVHEDDTAGGLMNSEFLTIAPDLSVGDALSQTKLLAADVETVYYAYVVDSDENLLGVVSLKELLITPPETPVTEIMTSNLKTVKVDAEPEEILELIAKYNLIAIPVLDENEKIAGIVTVDDILELFLPYALRRRRYRHH
ncbi:MAG TPA: CBS domain-containing protein [Geomobilimonas sp.]|nr:CBS domain-containing protein [Geomobilimonas sp.]